MPWLILLVSRFIFAADVNPEFQIMGPGNRTVCYWLDSDYPKPSKSTSCDGGTKSLPKGALGIAENNGKVTVYFANGKMPAAFSVHEPARYQRFGAKRLNDKSVEWLELPSGVVGLRVQNNQVTIYSKNPPPLNFNQVSALRPNETWSDLPPDILATLDRGDGRYYWYTKSSSPMPEMPATQIRRLGKDVTEVTEASKITPIRKEGLTSWKPSDQVVKPSNGFFLTDDGERVPRVPSGVEAIWKDPKTSKEYWYTHDRRILHCAQRSQPGQNCRSPYTQYYLPKEKSSVCPSVKLTEPGSKELREFCQNSLTVEVVQLPQEVQVENVQIAGLPFSKPRERIALYYPSDLPKPRQSRREHEVIGGTNVEFYVVIEHQNPKSTPQQAAGEVWIDTSQNYRTHPSADDATNLAAALKNDDLSNSQLSNILKTCEDQNKGYLVKINCGGCQKQQNGTTVCGALMNYCLGATHSLGQSERTQFCEAKVQQVCADFSSRTGRDFRSVCSSRDTKISFDAWYGSCILKGTKSVDCLEQTFTACRYAQGRELMMTDTLRRSAKGKSEKKATDKRFREADTACETTLARRCDDILRADPSALGKDRDWLNEKPRSCQTWFANLKKTIDAKLAESSPSSGSTSASEIPDLLLPDQKLMHELDACVNKGVSSKAKSYEQVLQTCRNQIEENCFAKFRGEQKSSVAANNKEYLEGVVRGPARDCFEQVTSACRTRQLLIGGDFNSCDKLENCVKLKPNARAHVLPVKNSSCGPICLGLEGETYGYVAESRAGYKRVVFRKEDWERACGPRSSGAVASAQESTDPNLQSNQSFELYSAWILKSDLESDPGREIGKCADPRILQTEGAYCFDCHDEKVKSVLEQLSKRFSPEQLATQARTTNFANFQDQLKTGADPACLKTQTPPDKTGCVYKSMAENQEHCCSCDPKESSNCCMNDQAKRLCQSSVFKGLDVRQRLELILSLGFQSRYAGYKNKYGKYPSGGELCEEVSTQTANDAGSPGSPAGASDRPDKWPVDPRAAACIAMKESSIPVAGGGLMALEPSVINYSQCDRGIEGRNETLAYGITGMVAATMRDVLQNKINGLPKFRHTESGIVDLTTFSRQFLPQVKKRYRELSPEECKDLTPPCYKRIGEEDWLRAQGHLKHNKNIPKDIIYPQSYLDAEAALERAFVDPQFQIDLTMYTLLSKHPNAARALREGNISDSEYYEMFKRYFGGDRPDGYAKDVNDCFTCLRETLRENGEPLDKNRNSLDCLARAVGGTSGQAIEERSSKYFSEICGGKK